MKHPGIAVFIRHLFRTYNVTTIVQMLTTYFWEQALLMEHCWHIPVSGSLKHILGHPSEETIVSSA